MVDTHLHWLVFHMGLEDAGLVVATLLFSNAEEGLRRLVGTRLQAYRRSSVVGLVQLPLVLVGGIARAFWHRPVRLVLVHAGQGTFLRMIGTRANNFRGGVEFDQRVKALDCSSGVETELRLCGYLRLQSWHILRSGRHLVLLLLRRKLK